MGKVNGGRGSSMSPNEKRNRAFSDAGIDMVLHQNITTLSGSSCREWPLLILT